jgi:parvulin-like peptidyl-prolyl isomerase
VRTALRPVAALAAVLLLVAGCNDAADDDATDPATDDAAATAEVSPGAAATVDGTDIPMDRLEEAVREVEADAEDLDAEERAAVVEPAQRQILSLLIQATVFDNVADERGVDVSDEDIAETREEILENVGGEDGLEDALQQSGLSLGLFEDVIVRQEAIISAIADDLLGDQDLETRTARHILVESEEEADEVVADLEDGADFGELAQEVSVDVGSGELGGDLGPAPRGAYVPEFDEAVWESDFNEVVGPVESQFGFHIVEVLEEDVTPADELDDAQVQQLIGPELNELLGGALAEADVAVDPAIGVWDPATNSVVTEDEVGQPQQPSLDDLEGDELPPELQEQLDELEQELGDDPAQGDVGDDPAEGDAGDDEPES